MTEQTGQTDHAGQAAAATSPGFKTVRHGYDPQEVDRHLAELSQAAVDANSRAESLHRQMAELTDEHEAATAQAARATEASQGAKTHISAQPTFHDFGKRVGHILAMAEEEAEEMRTAAVAEVHRRLADADATAASTREDADRYAQETRSSADEHAARLVEDAKRNADQMADQAERMAIARNGEAEAHYEEQRARAAKAAADFEQTLAERRDKAEAMFQDRTESAEQELDAARNRVAKLRAEGDQLQAETSRRAAQATADAERKAEQIIADAMERADRVRAESERELSAAVQRRNAINAQLTNVRQMLATLSGAAPAASLDDPFEQQDDKSDDETSAQKGDGASAQKK
jgi:cell division septum initiation protein DivIVA